MQKMTFQCGGSFTTGISVLVLLTESYQSSRVYTALHIDSDESGHVDIVGNKARVDGNS